MRRSLWPTMLALILLWVPVLEAQDIATLRKATRFTGGLVVHVGAGEGDPELALVAEGKALVQTLVADHAQCDRLRAAIAQRKIDGLATAVVCRDFTRLPYGDQMVNLLIVDLDALKDRAPAEAEILRVLAPGGSANLRRAGRWTTILKPRPSALDDWGHFDHGPDGNGVSSDQQVRQPEQLQWISGVKEIVLGGNPAGYDPGAGVRAAGGRLVVDYSVQDPSDKRRRRGMLGCYDAFSGLPLWKITRDMTSARRRWQLVIDDHRIYTFIDKDGPLVALDPLTGATLTTYALAEGKRLAEDGTHVRVAGDVVVTNLDRGVYAMEASTGRLRWKYEAPGAALVFPVIDTAGRRVYVIETDPVAGPKGRWPWSMAQALHAISLDTGKLLWRSEAVAGKPVGQIIPAGEFVVLFCGSAISGRAEGGWIGSVRAGDGSLVGEGTFKSAWNDSMYNAIVRDGRAYYAGHTTIYRTALDAVEIQRAASLSYNQRCNRFAATRDWFISGYVTWWDRDFTATLQSVARAGCAIGATPANGMVYFTPSACGCFTQLRGYNAMTPEPVPAPVPDDQRLEKAGPGALPLKIAPLAASLPEGPVADEWMRWGERPVAEETAPVEMRPGLSVVAAVQRHRIEARTAQGAVRWSFIAGGRVSSPPVVVDDKVIFGCHDGWVYAVNADRGTLVWRHLVAPSERWMVAYGQMESSWPVYGVVMREGEIIASAGRHPEIGGGVFVAGLDPATGAARWRRTLAKPVAKITTAADGRSRGVIVPRSFLNKPPTVVEGGIDIGGFVFTPAESDAQLQTRLNTPPPPKKK